MDKSMFGGEFFLEKRCVFNALEGGIDYFTDETSENESLNTKVAKVAEELYIRDKNENKKETLHSLGDLRSSISNETPLSDTKNTSNTQENTDYEKSEYMEMIKNQLEKKYPTNSEGGNITEYYTDYKVAELQYDLMQKGTPSHKIEEKIQLFRENKHQEEKEIQENKDTNEIINIIGQLEEGKISGEKFISQASRIPYYQKFIKEYGIDQYQIEKLEAIGTMNEEERFYERLAREEITDDSIIRLLRHELQLD